MKKFTGMGIRKKTVTILLGTFLVSLLFCGIVFSYVYHYMQNSQRKDLVVEADRETRENIAAYLEKVDELSYNVAYSTWMQKVFDRGISDYERQKRINDALNVMNTLAFLNSDVQFSIFMLEGVRFNSNEWFSLNPDFEVEDQEWFPYLTENKKYIWSGEEQQVYFKNKDWCIMPFYMVKNYNSLDLEAYLSVHISKETFCEEVLEGQVNSGCYQSLIDPEGNYIYTGMPESLQEKMDFFKNDMAAEWYSGRQFTAAKSEVLIGEKAYYLLSVLENDRAAAVNGTIWLVFGGIIGLLAVILIVIAVIISKYITRPVIKCRDAMSQIVNNNLGIRVDNPYKDEFGEMLESFNEMSDSIYELIEINKNISVLQKDAEYKLLERQINPHFLFNTLELINALIMNGEEERARKVCETLGELYHYNLRQEKYITLKEEMEYTKQYLYLMTYKVHNLSFYYDMEESLEDRRILKVILQPLVENSIRHGFTGNDRDCCITLMAEKTEDEEIFITAMDNGKGMDTETLQQLREQIETICENPEIKQESSKHIGIKNVVQRLALEYGENFKIHIDSRENFGVRVELTIKGGA